MVSTARSSRNERLAFAWGATDGWPQLDLDDLDRSPQVTLVLMQGSAGIELTLHVELSADLPDVGVPGWWPMVRGGWSDPVDRLAAELTRSATLA